MIRERNIHRSRRLLRRIKVSCFFLLSTISIFCPLSALAQDATISLVFDGLTRTAVVHLPLGYSQSGSKQYPVILGFHGGGGNAPGFRDMAKMNAASDSKGFIAVYPNGTGGQAFGTDSFTWNAGECCGTAKDNNVDDVGFISALIDRLIADYRVDASRIYATGLSNGAQISYRLACELSCKIAAIAPVAGQGIIHSCEPIRPVPTIHLHGDADECATYSSGECGGCFQEFMRQLGIPAEPVHWRCEPVPQFVADWAAQNGCAPTPTVSYSAPGVQCISYSSCTGNADVSLCTEFGMGHTWPGGTNGLAACDTDPNGLACRTWKSIVGPLSNALPANDAMWDFFMAHPLTTCSAPTIQASDRAFLDSVKVTWARQNGAVGYRVLRDQFDRSSFLPVSAVLPPETTMYVDKTAVPGVKYHYALEIIPATGSPSRSQPDDGTRASFETPDCDADGASDLQEVVDLTPVCDPGGSKTRLESPTYTKYNTYLGQYNFLELLASGTAAVNAEVTVYAASGSVLGVQSIFLQPGQEFDVDVHSMVARADTYGVVRIVFNNTTAGATLSGRMSHYRVNPDGQTYSFAFSRELRNPTRGPTFVTGNSFDPQGRGYVVPNWAEIINIDQVPREFSFTLFNQAGVKVSEELFSLPAFAERDFAAGHQYGEGVFLSRVIPKDGATKYLAAVSRYSSNTPLGETPNTYNYAFQLESHAGAGVAQYVPLSNRKNSCWTQFNWLEVANTREMPLRAYVDFRDSGGVIRHSTEAVLPPYSQYHFNANAFLPTNQNGSATVRASDPAALLVQSAVYYRDSANVLQTAYVSPAQVNSTGARTGTFNLFLGMNNYLSVLNTAPASQTLRLNIFSAGAQVSTLNTEVPAGAKWDFSLGNTALFNVKNDTYGVFKIEGAGTMNFISENLRERLSSNCADFAFPTAVR